VAQRGCGAAVARARKPLRATLPSVCSIIVRRAGGRKVSVCDQRGFGVKQVAVADVCGG